MDLVRRIWNFSLLLALDRLEEQRDSWKDTILYVMIWRNIDNP